MEYNSTLEMDIPKGWEVKNIQKVCIVVNQRAFMKIGEGFLVYLSAIFGVYLKSFFEEYCV